MPFHYYPDRQSPWVLAHTLEGHARVASLCQTPFGKLLDRPGLKPLVAQSGGTLHQGDVQALAHADRFEAFDGLSRAGLAALEAVWSLQWQDFLLSFTHWGTCGEWDRLQMSRPGGHLVIQLGFPGDHAALMGRYLDQSARRKFEETLHPSRKTGRPTLAWARVDIDFDRGEALIEEVQSDWLHLVKAEVEWLAQQNPRSRETIANQAYKQAVFRQYAKLWPNAMLLATLMVLRDVVGLRRIWMHQPGSGAILKGIRHTLPPRSLYTALPKAFCFAPVAEMPEFIVPSRRRRQSGVERNRRKAVQHMARLGVPVFWRLDL